MRISIPYELVKIYRDKGISLSEFSVDNYIGESYEYTYFYDDFINGAF